jgi:CheY-like chemotaxis protein
MMPGGMNGVELARELRKRRPEIPVLLTSGYAADARQQAEQAEQDHMALLPKPYTLDDLSIWIARTLDRAAECA